MTDKYRLCYSMCRLKKHNQIYTITKALTAITFLTYGKYRVLGGEKKMGFYDKMEEETTKKLTLNNSPTYSSSLNKNLDLFALGGAARNWEDADIQVLFMEAYREEPETALRNLVHLRNIRHGGLGERKAFRASIDYLTKLNSSGSVLMGLVKYLPELGRWDDVVYIFSKTQDKELRKEIAKILSLQLLQDTQNMKENKSVTLLAKWMPSNTATSEDTRRLAKELINYMFGKYSPRHEKIYRKTLTNLRKNLDVVEVKMTDREWDKIDYSKVPSVAAIKYRKAFYRNDTERYEAYLDGLSQGKTKVNASVTYPYQIIQAYNNEYREDTLLEEAWKALPDYIGDSEERAVVVADVSGSMTGTPMDVSISLAIYCAQRLKGEFHGKYISFSANPTMNNVYDNDTLLESIQKVRRTDWGMSTDINKVFRLILNTAVNHNMTQEELPNKILIISDMEFDEANGGSSWWSSDKAEELTATNYQVAKQEFERHGYTIPQVIFWNVDAKSSVIPVRKDEVGTALVSGLTPTIFQTVLNGSIENPEQLMRDTLYQEKYDFVKEFLING